MKIGFVDVQLIQRTEYRIFHSFRNLIILSIFCLLLHAMPVAKDEEVAELAHQWYQVFTISIPFFVTFWTIQKFLSAQEIMTPLIVAIVISLVLVLPVSLWLLTETCGFIGSAWAYVIYEASMMIFTILYLFLLQPHDDDEEVWNHVRSTIFSWKSWKDVALYQRNQFLEYAHLGLGGLLGQSEWYYWEVLTLIVGRIHYGEAGGSVIPLASHGILSSMAMALCQIPAAFGEALMIRIGINITSCSTGVSRAKNLCITTLGVIATIFGLVSYILCMNSDWIISIFIAPSDEENQQVITLTEHIWWKLCLCNWIFSVMEILRGIATGLGKQMNFGIVSFLFLWVLGIPITIYTSLGYPQRGLEAVWTWINIPYGFINTSMLLMLFVPTFTNWNAIRDKILQEEEEVEGDDVQQELQTSSVLMSNANHHQSHEYTYLLPTT